jgi:hypothetical protein
MVAYLKTLQHNCLTNKEFNPKKQKNTGNLSEYFKLVKTYSCYIICFIL